MCAETLLCAWKTGLLSAGMSTSFFRKKRPAIGLNFSRAFQYYIQSGRANTYIFDSFQPFSAILCILLNADATKMGTSRAVPYRSRILTGGLGQAVPCGSIFIPSVLCPREDQPRQQGMSRNNVRDWLLQISQLADVLG
jgi:hypothetical protein